MDAPIWVNRPALQAAGIDRDTPITIALKDIPFHKALDVILAQVPGTTFATDDGIINVSTPTELTSNKYQIVKVYDIRGTSWEIPPQPPHPPQRPMLKPIASTT